MTRRILMAIVGIVIIAGVVLGVTAPKASGRVIINDVSWPNCKVVPPKAALGIIGVTGGLDFRANPCLAQEASWFAHYALYINTGYPGIAYGREFLNLPRHCRVNDSSCLAYNYGYNASLYAIEYAKSQGVQAPLWWLDVETDNSWTNNPTTNRAALQGAIDALRQRVFVAEIGFYSSPGQWDVLTKDWHNGLPNWVATGGSSRSIATSFCVGQNFTGGSTWLTQYTLSLDANHPCAQDFLGVWQKQ